MPSRAFSATHVPIMWTLRHPRIPHRFRNKRATDGRATTSPYPDASVLLSERACERRFVMFIRCAHPAMPRLAPAPWRRRLSARCRALPPPRDWARTRRAGSFLAAIDGRVGCYVPKLDYPPSRRAPHLPRPSLRTCTRACPPHVDSPRRPRRRPRPATRPSTSARASTSTMTPPRCVTRMALGLGARSPVPSEQTSYRPTPRPSASSSFPPPAVAVP